MPKSPLKEILVTVTSLKTQFQKLDHKIDNVALSLLTTNQRLERVENTMSTKADWTTAMDRIDFFTKRVAVFDQEESVQSLHIKEVREKVNDHETRLLALERHTP